MSSEPTPKPRVAVLWCNLGTPDAPTAPAVRRYLAEFLSDRRVVELPRVLWLPLLYLLILPLRARASAAKYRSIWLEQGSPLAYWTKQQALGLQHLLAQRGLSVSVLPAMRYGQPSMGTQLQALAQQQIDHVLILSAYPQYSGTTSASLYDAVSQWSAGTRRLPQLRLVASYPDNTGYINALAASVRAHWQALASEATVEPVDAPTPHQSPRHRPYLLMSFHGIPERAVRLGDPYAEHCRQTAQALAQTLGLAPGQWSLAYQSRFGRARWLSPSTVAELRRLAAAGVSEVSVVCPGFVADCLETLEEIQQEARAEFLAAGGRAFHFIPCLNDSPEWLVALADIVVQNLGGWPTA